MAGEERKPAPARNCHFTWPTLEMACVSKVPVRSGFRRNMGQAERTGFWLSFIGTKDQVRVNWLCLIFSSSLTPSPSEAAYSMCPGSRTKAFLFGS